METLYFIFILGVIMVRHLNACPHQWIIKLNQTLTGNGGYIIEKTTIHECYHCKKLKKETIKI
jgi:hypothetical protein